MAIGEEGEARTGGEGPGEGGDPEVGGGAGRPHQPGGCGHGHDPWRRRRRRRGETAGLVARRRFPPCRRARSCFGLVVTDWWPRFAFFSALENIMENTEVGGVLANCENFFLLGPRPGPW